MREPRPSRAASGGRGTRVKRAGRRSTGWARVSSDWLRPPLFRPDDRCPQPVRRRPPGIAARGSPRPVPRGRHRVSKAIRIRHGSSEKLIAADIECTVDLDSAQKGVHMSRFPELFEEVIEHVVLEEAFLVEELAAHIAGEIVERQGAGRAEARITARYPVERRTPVTGLATQAMLGLIGIAAASERGVRRVVGVEAAGINACPCAQGLVREPRLTACSRRASRRATSSGSCSSSRSRHNQRGSGRCSSAARRGERGAARRDRRVVDERAGLRAAQAPGRALRRRARAPPAALRGGLGPPGAAGRAGRLSGTGRRRLPLLAPGQPGDDPHARRGRRALWHGS